MLDEFVKTGDQGMIQIMEMSALEERDRLLAGKRAEREEKQKIKKAKELEEKRAKEKEEREKAF